MIISPVMATTCAFINITQGIQGIQGIPGEMNLTINQTINLTPGAPGPDNDAWYAWINGSRPFSANISMGGFNISELLDPIAPQDAATKSFCEALPAINSTYLTVAINDTYTTTAFVNAVNDSMRTNVSMNFPTFTVLTAVNDSMRTNVSMLFALKTSVPDVQAFAANDTLHFANETSLFSNLSATNQSMIANVSTWMVAFNNSMNTNVSSYITAVNNSMRTNVSQNYPTTAYVNSEDFRRDGYAINVIALTSSPAKNVATYFGMNPVVPSTTAGNNKIYIRKAGYVVGAEIYCYSGTASTNQIWNLSIIKNAAASKYLINELQLATNERIWTNWSLGGGIPVASGDYLEIKSTQPGNAWAPLTTTFGGYLYLNVT